VEPRAVEGLGHEGEGHLALGPDDDVVGLGDGDLERVRLHRLDVLAVSPDHRHGQA
jgi:hypothetical protein